MANEKQAKQTSTYQGKHRGSGHGHSVYSQGRHQAKDKGSK